LSYPVITGSAAINPRHPERSRAAARHPELSRRAKDRLAQHQRPAYPQPTEPYFTAPSTPRLRRSAQDDGARADNALTQISYENINNK
jgi:hypothetical protein